MKVSKKTGINNGYANEFIACRSIVIKYKDNPEKAYEKMRKYHSHSFRKYTQRGEYQSTRIKNKGQFRCLENIINAFRRYKQRKAYSVTRKNKRQVMYLDRIVDELNGMLENPFKFSYERVRTLTDRAFVLIYGKNKFS